MTPREWLVNYCEETIANEKYRCKKHRQACKRCLDMLKDNDKWYFDEAGAENIVKFFALLHHSKGVISGKPIILDGLSKFIVYNLYGFKYYHKDYRVFRKAFISMGRKGQKSQLQAGIILYEMSVMAVKWNTMNCCVCTGVSRRQSKVIFDECKLMLKGSVLAPKFRITRDLITHIKSGSTLEALSKEAKKDGEGGNIQLGVIDEWKDHPDTMLYEVIETGQKALAQPLLVIISTAGNNMMCPMRTQDYPYAEKILAGVVENENYFTVICEVEANDDIDDWKVWQKANQLLFTYEEGINGLKESYQMAKEIPEKLTSFLVKNLNIWQNKAENGYINIDKFKKCMVKKIPYDLKGNDVYIGIDVSSKTDLTAVTFEFPVLEGENLKFAIKNHSFIPNEEKLMEHIKIDKMPFEMWVREGYITITNTPIVDQAQVINYCLDMCKSNGWNIRAWAIDPHNASLLTTTLLDLGEEVFEIYQSAKHLNEPTVDLREQIYSENVIVEENPCYLWQMSNARIIENSGLIKIDKYKQKERIDNVDITICSHKLAMYWKPPEPTLEERLLSGDYFC